MGWISINIYRFERTKGNFKKESEMEKIKGYKPPTLSLGDLYHNRSSHGFLDFFLVQANIRIPFLISQNILQDETQSMHSQCYPTQTVTILW